MIGGAFAALAVYLMVQSTVVLIAGYHPRHSALGVMWMAITAVAMFALAVAKARVGAASENPALETEGRVTLIDGLLASAVPLGLVLNAAWVGGGPIRPPIMSLSAMPSARSGNFSALHLDRGDDSAGADYSSGLAVGAIAMSRPAGMVQNQLSRTGLAGVPALEEMAIRSWVRSGFARCSRAVRHHVAPPVSHP